MFLTKSVSLLVSLMSSPSFSSGDMLHRFRHNPFLVETKKRSVASLLLNFCAVFFSLSLQHNSDIDVSHLIRDTELKYKGIKVVLRCCIWVRLHSHLTTLTLSLLCMLHLLPHPTCLSPGSSPSDPRLLNSWSSPSLCGESLNLYLHLLHNTHSQDFTLPFPSTCPIFLGGRGECYFTVL